MKVFYGKSDVPYVSVERAAEILRMNPYTLYRNMDDVPHVMVGNTYRIPVEFLLLEPPTIRVFGVTHKPEPFQPYLPFDVKPERRWRNTGRLVSLDPFGTPTSPSKARNN